MREAWGKVTRNAHLWLPGYLQTQWRRRGLAPPRHVWLAIADHFEPLWQRPSPEEARDRVNRWRQRWPEIAARHQDAEGGRPRYTFFYPQEEYRPELIEPLAEMTRASIADVEVHIHHDGEGEQEFVERMSGFRDVLFSRHGLLRQHEGRLAFGFIHGNWALDNSRPDGRWCGLNNEITLLKQLGCYADFTMPAAPNVAQGGPVNVIFRTIDDPLRPRSYDRGVAVLPGLPAVGDLTLIPGPLGLDFEDRPIWKPRLDTGEISGYHRPSPGRARLWLSVAPRIAEHVFIKLFTHGAQERNSGPLLEGGLDELFEAMSLASSELGASLHYCSAWDMWGAVEALRLGHDPLAGRAPLVRGSAPPSPKLST
jgi:hypothetical protein